MNERQHIALTEAQIIAAEKGEIQLEYRNGEKVCQVVWFRPPYNQNNSAIKTIDSRGDIRNHTIIGMSRYFEGYDLFVSEPAEQEQVSPKPIYEVGEIIEQIESAPNGWRDVEFIHAKGDQIVVWYDGQYRPAHKNAFRKKQTEKTVTLESKVMTVKEAFKYLTNIQ